MLERLSTAADRYRALVGQTDAERQLRDALIVEAITGGHTYTQVCAAVGLSRATVHVIVAENID